MASLACFVVLVLLATAFIVSPLTARGSRDRSRVEGERDRLLREKETLLQLIKDLDFDHRTAKISDTDHATARAEADLRAIAVLRELDHLNPGGRWSDDDLEAEIVRARERLRRESLAS